MRNLFLLIAVFALGQGTDLRAEGGASDMLEPPGAGDMLAPPPAAAPPPVNRPPVPAAAIPLPLGPPAAASASDNSQWLASEFVELTPFEPVPTDIVHWDPDSARYLTVGEKGGMIHFKGKLAPGYEMFFDEHWVPVGADRSFDVPIVLYGETRVLNLRLFDPMRSFRIYPFVYFWIKIPPVLRVRFQEGNQVVQQAAGYLSLEHRIGFAQLYSGGAPTEIVDLDTLRDATLTFRIYIPPNVTEACDSWKLVIDDDAGHEVARVWHKGFPPPFVDWNSLGGRIATSGEYSYHLIMTYGSRIYDGSASHFHAFAGSHIFAHDYTPALMVEPRQEFGYFNYSSAEGGSFSSSYLAADLALVFWERALLRIDGMTALQGDSSTGSLTSVRAGAGVRLWGYEPNTAIGGTLLFQLDGLVNYSSLALSPLLHFSHYDSPSILLEPKIVFLSRHQIVPWVEYGFRSPHTYQRLSMALEYRYYIRSWRLAVGLGGAFDKLLVYADDPALRYTVSRFFTDLVFYL